MKHKGKQGGKGRTDTTRERKEGRVIKIKEGNEEEKDT